MGKGRLEAFSDGVLAIIITVMLLEIKLPAGPGIEALRPLVPILLMYLLSFAFVGIYWNNHHHLLHVARLVDGRVLWANMILLFWLSLVPLVTGWLAQNGGEAWPTACYGIVLLMAALSYGLLVAALIARNGKESELARALGSNVKGKVSAVLYLVAIGLAFVWPAGACGLYALVALMWVVPDRRIEGNLKADAPPNQA